MRSGGAALAASPWLSGKAKGMKGVIPFRSPTLLSPLLSLLQPHPAPCLPLAPLPSCCGQLSVGGCSRMVCAGTRSGVSLLKPAAWDPGRHGDARHRHPVLCKEVGALTPRPPTSLSADRGGIELTTRPWWHRALPGSPQDGLFLQDPAGGSSADQVPMEGITRRHLWCGCNARGACPKPVAFHSLPWHVAALPCFSRFLFCVCVSGG